MASLRKQQHKLEDALQRYTMALRLLGAVVLPDQPPSALIASTHQEMAELFVRMGRRSDARDSYRSAVEGFTASLGEQHRCTQAARKAFEGLE